MFDLLDAICPPFLKDDMYNVDKTYTLSEKMLHTRISHVPDWFETKHFFTNLLNKNPLVPSNYDPSTEAVKVFLSDENSCASYSSNFHKLQQHPKFGVFLHTWKREVHAILRRSPRLSGLPPITTGATTSCPKGTPPVSRISSGEITIELFDFLSEFGPIDPKFLIHKKIKLVKGSCMFLVSKTAKISRIVCPEPSHNALVQRWIGLDMRTLLMEHGIDLSIAPENHKMLAELASSHGGLTTDDLTSASHLASYVELVKYLLPRSWYAWCNAARSHYVKTVDENYWELQHFMTNGNGFCFELETIIFFSMLRACALHHGCVDSRQPHRALTTHGADFSSVRRLVDLYCFGDDLIYDSSLTSIVRSVCKNVGFKTNLTKSFSEGYFRESCGGDYWNGHNIRPIYMKGDLSDVSIRYVLANLIFQKYGAKAPYWIRRARLLLLRSIPNAQRHWGPERLGHVVLHTEFRSRYRIRKSKWRWTQPTLISKPKDYVSFGNLVNEGLEMRTTIQLISAGFMGGWGVNSPKLCQTPLAEGAPCGTCKVCTSPPKYKAVFPKPGTDFISVTQYTGYYERPSLVDETDPLSVFRIRTSMPRRMSCNDYAGVSAREKFKLLSKLLGIMKYRESTLPRLELVQEIVIDFDF